MRVQDAALRTAGVRALVCSRETAIWLRGWGARLSDATPRGADARAAVGGALVPLAGGLVTMLVAHGVSGATFAAGVKAAARSFAALPPGTRPASPTRRPGSPSASTGGGGARVSAAAATDDAGASGPEFDVAAAREVALRERYTPAQLKELGFEVCV